MPGAAVRDFADDLRVLLAAAAQVAGGPDVLSVRGDSDQIVSDTSLVDLGYLGQLGAVPGWPGAEPYPRSRWSARCARSSTATAPPAAGTRNMCCPAAATRRIWSGRASSTGSSAISSPPPNAAGLLSDAPHSRVVSQEPPIRPTRVGRP